MVGGFRKEPCSVSTTSTATKTVLFSCLICVLFLFLTLFFSCSFSFVLVFSDWFYIPPLPLFHAPLSPFCPLGRHPSPKRPAPRHTPRHCFLQIYSQYETLCKSIYRMYFEYNYQIFCINGCNFKSGREIHDH